jgi:hypothetical protein
VLEALQTLERRPNSSTWDANGHRRAVRAGVASVLRRDDPESFPDEGVTV